MQKNQKSFLISFEGIEGAGKSTQIKLFCDKLQAQNLQFESYREPGGTLAGEKLRELVLNCSEKLAPLTETYIFLAARCELLSKKVLPALAQNKIVILDRYIDSTVAYQGQARGLGTDKIINLHNDFPLNKRPDLTFYLRINLETSLQRQQNRGSVLDYFEKEDKAFYQKLIDGLDEMSKKEVQRIEVIDAALDIKTIEQLIWQHFLKRLNHG